MLLAGRTSDQRVTSSNPALDNWYCVITLSKLFTPVCFCHKQYNLVPASAGAKAGFPLFYDSWIPGLFKDFIFIFHDLCMSRRQSFYPFTATFSTNPAVADLKIAGAGDVGLNNRPCSGADAGRPEARSAGGRLGVGSGWGCHQPPP